MKTIYDTSVSKRETRLRRQYREAAFVRSLSDRELRNVFMNTTQSKDPIRWQMLSVEMRIREAMPTTQKPRRRRR